MPSYLRNLSFADILVLLNPWPRSGKTEHNNRNVNLHHILDLTVLQQISSKSLYNVAKSRKMPFLTGLQPAKMAVHHIFCNIYLLKTSWMLKKNNVFKKYTDCQAKMLQNRLGDLYGCFWSAGQGDWRQQLNHAIIAWFSINKRGCCI